MGKGSRPRPKSITRQEEELRSDYAFGNISLAVFNRRFAKLKKAGLIQRNGRVLK